MWPFLCLGEFSAAHQYSDLYSWPFLLPCPFPTPAEACPCPHPPRLELPCRLRMQRPSVWSPAAGVLLGNLALRGNEISGLQPSCVGSTCGSLDLGHG